MNTHELFLAPLLVSLAATVNAAPAHAHGRAQDEAADPAREEKLETASSILALAREAHAAGDRSSASGMLAEAMDALAADRAAGDDPRRLALWIELSEFSDTLDDVRASARGWREVLDVLSRTLPADSTNLQFTRLNLARRLNSLGDLEAARELEEAALAVLSRTLAADDPALPSARMNHAQTLVDLGEFRAALAIEEEVLAFYMQKLPRDHPRVLSVLSEIAVAKKGLGDLRGAREVQEEVLAGRLRQFPEDHPDVLGARGNLSTLLLQLGDLHGARALAEAVLEACERRGSPDSPDLQIARLNLAAILADLGDERRALELVKQAHDVRARTLPEDHPELQMARAGLALRVKASGDLTGALALQEKVLAAYLRVLPDEHHHVQRAQLNLAITLKELGDLRGAMVLTRKALEIRARTLPDDHPDLQLARTNYANLLHNFGDIQGARAIHEQVIETFARTLRDDHPDLQFARQNLAVTLSELGDLRGGQALFEKLLEVMSRTLPDDHTDLLLVRQNVIVTLTELGDFQGARPLAEQALEIAARALPDDHPDLQGARQGLANVLLGLGDAAGACALLEIAVDRLARTVAPEDPRLRVARLQLAEALGALGDRERALALDSAVLEDAVRTLPDDHRELQAARRSVMKRLALEVASGVGGVGGNRDAGGAHAVGGRRDVGREGDQGRERDEGREGDAGSNRDRARDEAPPRDSHRVNATPEDARTQEFGELFLAFTRALRRSAVAAIADASSREAEERVHTRAGDLSRALSFADGLGVIAADPAWQEEVFLASESMRSAALASARVGRAARGDPEFAALRSRARKASDELARIVQGGAAADELTRARVELEAAQRELVIRARALGGESASSIDAGLAALVARVPEGSALVAFRSYDRTRITGDVHTAGDVETAGGVETTDIVETADNAQSQPSSPRETRTRSMCAFVVRRDLARVELGPIAPIEAAVERWRETLGTSAGRGVAAAVTPASSDESAGATLRALVLDPLRKELAGVRRVIVVMDDVLHAVPLDALPADEVWSTKRGACIGDELEIEQRFSLFEILDEEEGFGGEVVLVTLGGVEYGAMASGGSVTQASSSASSGASQNGSLNAAASASSSTPTGTPTAMSTGPASQSPTLLRGGAWEHGFTPLPATLAEARELESRFVDAWGAKSEHRRLEAADATRERLYELAPRARFLHLATHGWFAPESVKAIDDPAPLDQQSGLGVRTSGEERVSGMSPMLLCGLALAGANEPAEITGRAPGLVTAEELSTLDLANCELAVLSACDTNVGKRRAGQGVASLQRALHMAGARSVVTSLWKVPDEATKELMLEFYRRLWVEKEPKGRALWEAKRKLREARDGRGVPVYATRDWGAWVLTGEG